MYHRNWDIYGVRFPDPIGEIFADLVQITGSDLPRYVHVSCIYHGRVFGQTVLDQQDDRIDTILRFPMDPDRICRQLAYLWNGVSTIRLLRLDTPPLPYFESAVLKCVTGTLQ